MCVRIDWRTFATSSLWFVVHIFYQLIQILFKYFFSLSRIPFTIQRLCELLTEPKRNYTGTEKFLRGVEKVSM